MSVALNNLGVVDIEHNEGLWMHICLESIIGQDAAVVHVDSDSTDNLVLIALAMGDLILSV